MHPGPSQGAAQAAAVKDKRGLLARPEAFNGAWLELGCGPHKQRADDIGIDMLDFDGVDLVGDVFEVLARVPSASVAGVRSAHFIEHVADAPRLVAEIARVLRPGGEVDMVAPHFSNPAYYADPTHRSFWALHTFCYWAERHPFKRRVPHYFTGEAPFDVEEVTLRFKALRGQRVANLWRRSWGLLFNRSHGLREFWEANLCWLVPCFELRYRLRRRAQAPH